MSEWHVRVVQLSKLGKHPNADTLSITDVEGYPVITKTGQYNEGDLAVYVPVDSIMPFSEDNFAMFGKSLRVRAKKIRGIFSQGVLVPLADPNKYTVGQIIHEELGISKYEISEDASRGKALNDPTHFTFCKYTDIEALRRYKHKLLPDEPVVITEKIHGANSRFVFDGEKLWVGSRRETKEYDQSLWWWKIGEKLGLQEKLKTVPGIILFGEVYGRGVQTLQYDTEITFRVFDTMDIKTPGVYNDWETTKLIVRELNLETVPVLYEGPWQGFEAHEPLSRGKSTIANHHREGFVVKPLKERVDSHIGRVIFKLVGEDYLLAK